MSVWLVGKFRFDKLQRLVLENGRMLMDVIFCLQYVIIAAIYRDYF